jgi:hypothetical protein
VLLNIRVSLNFDFEKRGNAGRRGSRHLAVSIGILNDKKKENPKKLKT